MKDSIVCTLGQYDIPIIQMQPDFQVDLLETNLAIYGSTMNGKTNMLRLIINILHKIRNEKNEQIFILDFGGALSAYEKMPLVSAYFDNSNEEYVKRIFKIMDSLFKENTKVLNGKIYKNCESESRPIHTTFIIDNLNSFINENRYSAYHDKFGRLCRDGASKGISIIFTATEFKGTGAYLLSFKQKIALNMPVDSYMDIFNEKIEAAGNVAGRGYANVTVKPKGVTGTFQMNSPYEIQAFLAESIEDENSDFVKKLNEKYQRKEEISLNNSYDEPYGKHVDVRYKSFPQELFREDYEQLKEREIDKQETSIEIGLDYVKCNPVSVDFNSSRTIAIYGKKEFGKTNLLSLIMKDFSDKLPYAKYIFFDDGRKQLQSFYDAYSAKGLNCEIINQFKEVPLKYMDGEYGEETTILKKLSPMQQFYFLLHHDYIDMKLDYMDILEFIYGRVYEDQIPSSACEENTRPTVFIIQSKSIYINSKMNSEFIRYILPELLDVAEERNYYFVFTDVKKITDTEVNSIFNTNLKAVFLLDNIAEFASERGGKTVFGDMDIKALKEEYAKCEIGDGFYYDVEADNIKKIKIIKNNWEDNTNE